MSNPARPAPPPTRRWIEPYKTSVILLSSTVLMVTWWYFAHPRYLAEHLPQCPRFLAQHLPQAVVAGCDRAAAGAMGTFALAFVLLGLIPALVVKLLFGEPLADYGVRLGNPVRTFRSMALFIPFFILMGYLGAGVPAFREYYPMNPRAGDSAAAFALHAAGYALLYLGWEFHFRGFLQLGLRRAMGDRSALMVQVLASTMLHVGRPAGEVYGAIAVGLLWGVLAYRTRSLLSGLAQHYTLAVSLDWFICRSGA